MCFVTINSEAPTNARVCFPTVAVAVVLVVVVVVVSTVWRPAAPEIERLSFFSFSLDRLVTP